MLIGGLQKTSLIDYPTKVTAIIFTIGCNFRCGYCHNPELIKLNDNSNIFSEEDFFNFLFKRKGLIDAVTITGGEPTLQQDLEEFIFKIKNLGFLVKLDTNGSNPKIIKNLLDKKLVDYVAMDIKAPIDKYNKITKVFADREKILDSIKIIMNSAPDYEFRTTVVKSLLLYEDFEKIGEIIAGAKAYYLQKFEATKILSDAFLNETTYTNDEFEEIKTILKKYVKFIYVR